MPGNGWESVAGNVLARFSLIGIAFIISLAPTSELQSWLLLAAFIALAVWIITSSHQERRRRGNARPARLISRR